MSVKIKNDEAGPAIGNETGGKDDMKFEDTNTAIYNIENDPGQLENLINSSEKERLSKEMKKKMVENDAPNEVLERFGF